MTGAIITDGRKERQRLAPVPPHVVRALHAVSGEIRGRAAQLRDADCLRPFPGEEMPLLLRVLRMATHDIYHAGQIQYLRALWRSHTT